MKPVFQKVFTHGNGDCLRAVIASLLEVKLEDVPHFTEYNNWTMVMNRTLEEFGYTDEDTFYNPRFFWSSRFTTKPRVDDEGEFPKLKEMSGINGYHCALVASPRFYEEGPKRPALHCVVIDNNYNIIHDPYYPKGTVYPLTDEVGYNGVLEVYVINLNKNN